MSDYWVLVDWNATVGGFESGGEFLELEGLRLPIDVYNVSLTGGTNVMTLWYYNPVSWYGAETSPENFTYVNWSASIVDYYEVGSRPDPEVFWSEDVASPVVVDWRTGTSYSFSYSDWSWIWVATYEPLPPPPPPPPNPDEPLHLVLSSADVTETNDTQVVQLTVTANKALDAPYEIPLRVTLNGELATADFIDPDHSVTMPAGQTSTTVTFILKGDALHEPDETFAVDVTSGVSYDPSQIRVTDDDGPYLTIGSLTGSLDKVLIYEQGLAGKIGIQLSESVDYAIDLNVSLSGEGWENDVLFSQHIVIPENTTYWESPLVAGLRDAILERPEQGTFTFTATALGSDEKIYFGLEGSGNQSATLALELRDVAQGILDGTAGMPTDATTATRWVSGFEKWFDFCEQIEEARKNLPEAQAAKILGVVAKELGVVIDAGAITQQWSAAFKLADKLDKSDPVLADQIRETANLQATENLASQAVKYLASDGVAFAVGLAAAGMGAPVLGAFAVGAAGAFATAWVYDEFVDPAVRKAAGEAYLNQVHPPDVTPQALDYSLPPSEGWLLA
ncbi:hypothetical protein [Rhizobium sp. MHM7A]|uniref:hypothetical protein n=1 Tax=Rhizobium sp. MHM7A TaxID=2583233 RepID=UPI001106DC8F|nr:hypothetical protein [Rhizobium sp. MHM7A]TLX17176.1 hypothetical protein FFR93_07655 [Rhizobium sp. MHM7A]